MTEIWKDISEYEGKYQVSNLGNVRSLNYNKTGKIKLLSPGYSKNYYHVRLWGMDGKAKCIKIHRLVAQTFIINNSNCLCVNHKDENKANNKLDNLEWCDYKYNANYGTAIERKTISLMGHVVSEETKQKISNANSGKGRKCKCITTNKSFNTILEASDYYKVNNSAISQCCRGTRRTIGKLKDGTPLTWEYE